MAETIDTAELFRRAMESRLVDVHVAMPAKVESFDAAKQTVDVIPQLHRHLPDGQGGLAIEALPKLANVPVAFPRAGGFFLSLPLQKGDYVLLIICERALGVWRTTGEAGDPGEIEMHSLSGAVAYAGIAPDSGKLTSPSGSLMRLGKDGDGDAQVEFAAGEVRAGAGANEAVAIASKVKADVDALAAVFDAWTPIAQDGGAALKTALSALKLGPPTWPASSYDSSNLKAKP